MELTHQQPLKQGIVGESNAHAAASKIDAAVIVNASAGGGRDADWVAKLVSQFAQVGLTARVTLAKNGDELAAASRAALDDGIALVVGGGGDGTLNAVVSHLVGTNAVFGILPLGTLNHFAKDLGVPLELDAAIHTIATGRQLQVDVAEVNGHIFVNNSSIGLYPQIVRHREQQQRLGRSKWNAFFWALLSAFRRFPFYRITVCVDGKEQKCTTPFVFIGNNRYTMEGFHIGERAHLDTGVISFYTARNVGRLGVLGLAFSALFGRLRQATAFETLSTTELTIETRRRSLRVSTDGEVTVMEAPLHYRIRPGALRVIVPSNNNARDAT